MRRPLAKTDVRLKWRSAAPWPAAGLLLAGVGSRLGSSTASSVAVAHGLTRQTRRIPFRRSPSDPPLLPGSVVVAPACEKTHGPKGSCPTTVRNSQLHERYLSARSCQSKHTRRTAAPTCQRSYSQVLIGRDSAKVVANRRPGSVFGSSVAYVPAPLPGLPGVICAGGELFGANTP